MKIKIEFRGEEGMEKPFLSELIYDFLRIHEFEVTTATENSMSPHSLNVSFPPTFSKERITPFLNIISQRDKLWCRAAVLTLEVDQLSRLLHEFNELRND